MGYHCEIAGCSKLTCCNCRVSTARVAHVLANTATHPNKGMPPAIVHPNMVDLNPRLVNLLVE